MRLRSGICWLVAVVTLFIGTGCSCGDVTVGGSGGGSGSTGGGSGSTGGGTGHSGGGSGSTGGGSTAGGGPFGTGGGNGSTDGGPDLSTCAGTAAARSYFGCDYWPTVTANNVWSIFDFAVVVANAGTVPANITITGPNGTNQTGTIQPNQLQKFYLPWVASLKGPDADGAGHSMLMTASVTAPASAYHLVSSVPVTVYQFNALEYGPQGGPAGKSWAACPGMTSGIGCFSYSNDASLLLPSTAMTGHYRVMGEHGWTFNGSPAMGPFVAITATQNSTDVTMKLGPNAKVLAGGTVPAQQAGGVFTLMGLSAGDVIEIVGSAGNDDDFSGSIISATNPVQVISGMPCMYEPENVGACDHLEESVFPAETLGKHYVVTVPTSPNGTVVGHKVRIFGNVDGTTLTYNPSPPNGCPTTLNAGQVVECGIVTQNFEVSGNQPFGVGTFMLGGLYIGGNGEGDPSQSFAVAVEQYRDSYLFLAPDDYDQSYVDIIAPPNTTVTVDGMSVTGFTAINASFSIARYRLTTGNGGSHTMTASAPVGIQVIGYGMYTSYQYPGGSNLTVIASPPIIN